MAPSNPSAAASRQSSVAPTNPAPVNQGRDNVPSRELSVLSVSSTTDSDLQIISTNCINDSGTPEMWAPLPPYHLRRGPPNLTFSIDMDTWMTLTRRFDTFKRGLVIGTCPFSGRGSMQDQELEVAAFYHDTDGIVVRPACVPDPHQPFQPTEGISTGHPWATRVPVDALERINLYPLIQVAMRKKGMGIYRWLEEYLRVYTGNGDKMAWPTAPVWTPKLLPHNRVTYRPV